MRRRFAGQIAGWILPGSAVPYGCSGDFRSADQGTIAHKVGYIFGRELLEAETVLLHKIGGKEAGAYSINGQNKQEEQRFANEPTKYLTNCRTENAELVK